MLEENVQNLMRAKAANKGTKSPLHLWKHLGLNPHFKSRHADGRVLWKRSSASRPLLHEEPEFLVIYPSRWQHPKFPGCLYYWIPEVMRNY